METKSSGNRCSSGSSEACRCSAALRSASWWRALVISELSPLKTFPPNTRSASVSSSRSSPAPVSVDVETNGASGHMLPASSICSCRGRSDLFTTTITGLFFVPNPMACSSAETCILFVQSLGTVEHEQHNVRAFSGRTTALDANLLNRIITGRDTGGIDEMKWNAAQIRHLFNCIASRSGNGRDDGALGTQQGIEEAGFSHIWPPNNRGTQSLPVEPSLLCSSE